MDKVLSSQLEEACHASTKVFSSVEAVCGESDLSKSSSILLQHLKNVSDEANLLLDKLKVKRRYHIKVSWVVSFVNDKHFLVKSMQERWLKLSSREDLDYVYPMLSRVFITSVVKMIFFYIF